MNTESAASSPRPIVAHPGQPPITATGRSLIVQEWSGSGPDYLHVHRRDDEAWHVLEGTLQFEFMDESVEATPGNTVFVPAGVPHTYREVVPSRYLIILTPRLAQLITELHSLVDPSQLTETLAKYETSLVERRNPRSGR
jgi:quercetin dioxygenase-like cupin family protein